MGGPGVPALLSPWSLLWLLAAVVVFGIYLLKPRSRRQEVSSTWLWHGVLKEESARSPVQWLKRHLLLLLQLLVAVTAAVLLARPALTRDQPVGHTVVLTLDASEAMLANDGDPTVSGRPAGSATRLDEAKGKTAQLLSQLRAGDHVVVLAAADHVELAAQGTLPGDLGALRSGIQRIQPLPTEINLGQALQVASGYALSARLGEIILVTGGVADTSQVEPRPPLAIQVLRVGRGDADNQAVTALSARRDNTGGIQVFARVRNFGDRPATGPLRINVDGQLFHETQITIPARNSWESVLTEFPPDAKVVQAQFGRADLLALDNLATTAVPAPSTRKVLLVGSRSDQLERALKAVPGVDLTKVDPQAYDPNAPFDIYVFENFYPTTPPSGNWLLIDPPARGSPVTVSGTLGRRTSGDATVNDAQVARIFPSPLLAGVDLTGITVGESKKVRLPQWAEEVVDARDAPLVFMGFPQPYRAVVFAFDLRATNFFGRVGFPVLVANTLNWLTGEAAVAPTSGMAVEGQFTPGDALLLQPLPRATRLEVLTPAGRTYPFEGSQLVRFLDTVRPGAYVVTQYDAAGPISSRTYVAAVVQPSRESALADLRPRPDVDNVSTVAGARPQVIQLGPGRETQTDEWWRLAGGLVLVGLVAEWWWFHR